MTKEINMLRVALGAAREKLELYRADRGDIHPGGVEYARLMRMIAQAMEASARFASEIDHAYVQDVMYRNTCALCGHPRRAHPQGENHAA